ncbi:MAG: hypothetical protein BMS9Abin10_0115 [Gammaproteobacteria bacterium]|nr:MAG: hypothetical protein BMS9Abin10_0115 [Gammaproteobacteria bacterium]
MHTVLTRELKRMNVPDKCLIDVMESNYCSAIIVLNI